MHLAFAKPGTSLYEYYFNFFFYEVLVLAPNTQVPTVNLKCKNTIVDPLSSSADLIKIII